MRGSLPDRGRAGLLLASSSVAALLIGGGAPAALAAPCNNPVTPPFSNAAAVTNICVHNGTFSGLVVNSGTVTPNGIAVQNATLTGEVISTGTLAGGISVDNLSRISGFSRGIAVTNTLTGGITNAGVLSPISAQSATGISAQVMSTFAGGIANTGTISTGANIGGGIMVRKVSAFSGGISNGGTITGGGTNTGGIVVGGPSPLTCCNVTTFTGGITNSGLITDPQFGIDVRNIVTFANGIVNSGTISSGAQGAISVAAVSVFSGGIVNQVSLNAVNAPGIVVGAVSTFSGGITNNGRISANVGVWLMNVSTFSGNVSNSGTIAAISGIRITNSTLTGGIVDSGVILGGAGFGINIESTSRIVGANTAIRITGPTLTGGLSNSGAVIGNANGLVISGVSTFSGNITNTGTITGGTNGIVMLAGVGLTNGGAIVNSGTIAGANAAIDVSAASTRVIIDQTGGLIGGNIKLSANADILNVTGGAISGSIIGSGSLDTVNFSLGAGSFTSSGPSNITGVASLNVLSGSVTLNGSANSATNVAISGGATLQIGDAAHTSAQISATLIDVSGTLSGHGIIRAGTVVIEPGGTFTPGGSIGTTSINGGLVFNSGSAYRIELSPTQHSQTVVTGPPGTVQINGGTVVIVPQLGTYSATTFAILTSTGTLSGTFNPAVVQNGSTTVNNPTLSYDAHDVFLSYSGAVTTLALPSGLSTNQRGVGTGINNFILAGGSVPAQFQPLGALSPGALPQALDQLSGEAATGAERGAFQLMGEFLELMLDPFVDGRVGPLGVGGTAPGFAPEQRAGLPADVALAYASVLKAPLAPPTPAVVPRWTMWGAAFGGANRANGEGAVLGSHDVSTQSFGVAAGLDYRVTPDTVFGIALAGGGTSWGLAQGTGGGSSDTFQAGVYGRTRWGNAYAAGAADFGSFWMKTSRTAFAGDRLEANFNAQGYGVRLESGYHFATPAVGVTPYAAVQALAFHSPAYAETDLNGGGFALAYNSRTANDTRSELGARFDHLTTFSNMPLMLRGRVAWAHDWVDDPALSAVFLALPGSNFSVFGAVPAKNSALTSAGAELRVTPTLSVSAKFDGQFASSTQTYAGSGTVRLTW